LQSVWMQRGAAGVVVVAGQRGVGFGGAGYEGRKAHRCCWAWRIGFRGGGVVAADLVMELQRSRLGGLPVNKGTATSSCGGAPCAVQGGAQKAAASLHPTLPSHTAPPRRCTTSSATSCSPTPWPWWCTGRPGCCSRGCWGGGRFRRRC
jgi:hypothetical protein